MQLYILGKNSDDKGNQLEKLTCEILKDLGFVNIDKNKIGSGGHEIDIKAEYIVSSLNGNNRKPIICECKAYKNAVSMTDWLKFLGKILLEEIKGNIDGYFIALSGINGYVNGNYQDLLTRRNNIKLITGEELITQLNRLFQLIDIKTIQLIIEKHTQRKPIETSLYYYNNTVYFLIGFSENEYSLITSSGQLIKLNEVIQIKSMIESCTCYQYFVDLENENNSLLRFENIKKYIISYILLEDKTLTFDEISAKFTEHNKQINDVNSDEIERALSTLINMNLVYKTDNNHRYHLIILSNKKQIDDVVRFYKYFNSHSIPLLAIGCEQYLNNINEDLLNKIQKIQGGTSIPKDYKEDCLKIIKWSPSALFWSLTPDKMITNHRSDGKAHHASLEEEDSKYIIQMLITLLSHDFKNNMLKEYFFNTYGFVELETNFKLKIKSKKKIELAVDYIDRLGLAKMAEKYNNEIIQIRIFNTQPEPWEYSK